MPGFTGHTVANSVALVGTSAFMYWQGWSLQDIFFVDTGIVISTLILSPDMDLFTSKPMNGWGILRVFWWPYSKLVKHRDRLHTPIVGTTVRWLYTLGLLALLVLLFRFWFRRIGLQVEFSFDGDREDIIFNLLYVLDVYIGAAIADALHFVLDMFVREPRRARGNRRALRREPDPSLFGE
ncbi:MAG: DUF2227 family putative metal-binding protein [Chloroflexi bacterium]|nr:DUF2227 family putative metal-binding protein [Chloroflexota bacterium]